MRQNETVYVLNRKKFKLPNVVNLLELINPMSPYMHKHQQNTTVVKRKQRESVYEAKGSRSWPWLLFFKKCDLSFSELSSPLSHIMKESKLISISSHEKLNFNSIKSFSEKENQFPFYRPSETGGLNRIILQNLSLISQIYSLVYMGFPSVSLLNNMLGAQRTWWSR